MKKEKGADPSLTEFYFRTHGKKDQSWVGVHAEFAYERMKRIVNQLLKCRLIWIYGWSRLKVERRNGGYLVLEPLPRRLSSNSQEADNLRSQVHALNASLQRQEPEKLEMKQQLQRKEKR